MSAVPLVVEEPEDRQIGVGMGRGSKMTANRVTQVATAGA